MTVLAAGALAAPVAFARPMPPSATDGAGRITKQPPAQTPEAAKAKTSKPEAHAEQPIDGVECLAKLHAAGWEAEPAKPAVNRSECFVPEPVAVQRLRVRDKSSSSLTGQFSIVGSRTGSANGPPIWLSRLSSAVSEPSWRRFGPDQGSSAATAITPSGKLSAHATGLAVDVAGLDLANGDHLLVTEATDQAKVGVLRTLRTGACG